MPIARLRGALDSALDLGLRERLAPEPDHPVGCPEGDYLKIVIYG